MRLEKQLANIGNDQNISFRLLFFVFVLAVVSWLMAATVVRSNPGKPRVSFQQQGSNLLIKIDTNLNQFNYDWFTTLKSTSHCQARQELSLSSSDSTELTIDLGQIDSSIVAICFQIEKAKKRFWYYYQPTIEISTEQINKQLTVSSNQIIESWQVSFVDSRLLCNQSNQQVNSKIIAPESQKSVVINLSKSQSKDWVCLKLKPHLSILKTSFYPYKIDLDSPSVDIVWEDKKLQGVSNDVDLDQSSWLYYQLSSDRVGDCSKPVTKEAIDRSRSGSIVSSQFLSNNIGRHICFNVLDKNGNLGFNSTKIISNSQPKIVSKKYPEKLIIESERAVKVWSWNKLNSRTACDFSNQNQNDWQIKKPTKPEFSLTIPVVGGQIYNGYYCFIIETETDQNIHLKVNLDKDSQFIGSINQNRGANIDDPTLTTVLVLLVATTTMLTLLRQRPVNY